jgi:hypothetical protein
MKVCATNRQPVALLAIGALDESQTEELRAHLQVCPGCRDYLAEIERVAKQLRRAEAPPEIQPSPFFHRRVQRSLLVERPRPAFGWRLAMPVFVMAAILLWTLRQPSPVLVSARPPAPAMAANNSDMSILNYQNAADQSLDKLDRILTEQGRCGLAATPIYFAGSFSAD